MHYVITLIFITLCVCALPIMGKIIEPYRTIPGTVPYVAKDMCVKNIYVLQTVADALLSEGICPLYETTPRIYCIFHVLPSISIFQAANPWSVRQGYLEDIPREIPPWCISREEGDARVTPGSAVHYESQRSLLPAYPFTTPCSHNISIFQNDQTPIYDPCMNRRWSGMWMPRGDSFSHHKRRAVPVQAKGYTGRRPMHTNQNCSYMAITSNMESGHRSLYIEESVCSVTLQCRITYRKYRSYHNLLSEIRGLHETVIICDYLRPESALYMYHYDIKNNIHFECFDNAKLTISTYYVFMETCTCLWSGILSYMKFYDLFIMLQLDCVEEARMKMYIQPVSPPPLTYGDANTNANQAVICITYRDEKEVRIYYLKLRGILDIECVYMFDLIVQFTSMSNEFYCIYLSNLKVREVPNFVYLYLVELFLQTIHVSNEISCKFLRNFVDIREPSFYSLQQSFSYLYDELSCIYLPIVYLDICVRKLVCIYLPILYWEGISNLVYLHLVEFFVQIAPMSNELSCKCVRKLAWIVSVALYDHVYSPRSLFLCFISQQPTKRYYYPRYIIHYMDPASSSVPDEASHPTIYSIYHWFLQQFATSRENTTDVPTKQSLTGFTTHSLMLSRCRNIYRVRNPNALVVTMYMPRLELNFPTPGFTEISRIKATRNVVSAHTNEITNAIGGSRDICFVWYLLSLLFISKTRRCQKAKTI